MNVEIAEEHQLPYFLGQIVINDSYAEHEARVLWNAFHAAGLVKGKRPEMFGRLLPSLAEALKLPEAASEYRDVVAPLIEETRSRHRYRRDLVHDLLSTGWGESR